MSLVSAATAAFERLPLPDAASRLAIEAMVGRTARRLGALGAEADAAFAAEMLRHPIALHTDAANAQHYELPPAFFGLVLGPRRKYSCCHYGAGVATLAAAEERALAETVAHADLVDGQRILELGCGWGSLSLWMAERFPASRITAVSNSTPQRLHIEAAAATRGLGNLEVVTADMNAFATDTRFDRVVSVEMFEHMANWRGLLARVKGWLRPDGRLLIHVFSHRSGCYRFDHGDPADWIANYFFTGGIMPSHGLIRQFPDLVTVEQEWRWSGLHYKRTADDWLVNYDRHLADIRKLLAEVYGSDADLWQRRWRLFFLATAGLFGHAGGEQWGVSHYRLRPTA